MATSVSHPVSARNQISGTVSNIQSGAAMSIVTIAADGHQLVSAITNQAVQELGLKPNDRVLALIKSTEALLIKGDAADIKISARNRISGRVTEIHKGNAMGCVTIDVGKWTLTSAITRQAIDELQIKSGEPVTAIFKATEVLLLKV